MVEAGDTDTDTDTGTGGDQPGEHRRTGAPMPQPSSSRWGGQRRAPTPLPLAILEALAAAALAALAWALLKGILELGAGLLGVAVVGGGAIGALLGRAHSPPPLAAAIAGLAWLGGLLLTWLLAMAILPGSSRTFLERLEGTPFLDWLAPQFGLLEVVGLVLYVVAALYGARRRFRAP